ncbi:MAG: carbohydrate ABC transporter permease, partial [Spirochaetota bacterium]
MKNHIAQRGQRKGRFPTGASIIWWLLGIVLGLLWIFPFYWMVVTSLKPESYILSSMSLVPERFTLEHYVTVFTKAPLLRWIFNSVFVSVAVTLLRLAISSTAGYALARMHFIGKGLIFAVLLASLMIPDEIAIVPLFIWVLKL